MKKKLESKEKKNNRFLRQKIVAIKARIVEKRWNNDLLKKKLEKTENTFFQIEKKLQNRSKNMKKFFE